MEISLSSSTRAGRVSTVPVAVHELGDSSVNLVVRSWVKTFQEEQAEDAA